MWPNPQETVDLVTFTEEITSNINKVIKAVLNSLFYFFTKRFRTHQKHQKHKKRK